MTILNEQDKPETRTTVAGRLHTFVIQSLLWLLDQLKVPIILICLFFFAGFGFYHGVIAGEGYTKMMHGKALIITLIDLNSDDEEAESE